MSFLFDGSVSAGLLAIVVIAVLFALGFEMVNGFHDTANAVATVIYTHSLTPLQAVVWSGFWNFLGVLTSSGAVAFAIVALLPIELILHVGGTAGFAMIFALLLSAMIWNLGTWYLGLPASSSHTLIGSIVGVGIANSMINGQGFGEGVNWGKLEGTMVALLTSPLIGFIAAAALLLVAKAVIRDPRLYKAPEGPLPPPLWIRSLLVLIGLLPTTFALHLDVARGQLPTIVAASRAAQPVFENAAAGRKVDDAEQADRVVSRFLTTGQYDAATMAALAFVNGRLGETLGAVESVRDLGPSRRSRVRRDIYVIDSGSAKLVKSGAVKGAEAAALQQLRGHLQPLIDYIPMWVKIAVALALGFGTMVGWRRIVKTLGEKIGKSHLTYAQGASAELVAAGTIGMADVVGMPVSTTHILSSGIAGAMFANRSGLQAATLRNILLAWVLTVPATVLLGSVLFAAGLYVALSFAG